MTLVRPGQGSKGTWLGDGGDESVFPPPEAPEPGEDPDPDEPDDRPVPGKDEEPACSPGRPLDTPAFDPATAPFGPNDIAAQGKRQWISLGPDPSGLPMRAFLTAEYEPTRSKQEMIEALLPDWVAWCAPSWASDFSMAEGCIKWVSEDHPGLFWDEGQGYYHHALMFAVLTLYGYRSEATDFTRMADTCRISESEIARWVEDERRWIKSKSAACDDGAWGTIQLTEDGQAIAERHTPGFLAWAFGGKVRLCARIYKVEAALADYYFYWAHRLYSAWMDGCGTDDYLELAYWCARAAMSEIIELASVILHELAHLTGSLFHCNPSVAETIPDFPVPVSASTTTAVIAAIVGWILGLISGGVVAAAAEITALEIMAALLLDSMDPPQDCCQYGLDRTFRVRLWAKLGCPKGHLYSGDWLDRAHTRFQSNAVDTWLSIDDDFAIDICEVPSGDNIIGHIYHYLVPGSSGAFQWSIPTDCSSSAAAGGGVVWT